MAARFARPSHTRGGALMTSAKGPLAIALFSIPFYPSIGGVEATTRILAQTLHADGHNVIVVTETPLPVGAAELSEGYEIVRTRKISGVLNSFSGADLIILKGGLSLRGALLAFIAGRPFGVVYEMFCTARQVLPLRERLLDFLRGAVMRRATFHVGVSRACLESQRLPPKTNAHVVYNAIDSEMWTLAESVLDKRVDEMIDVLYVGRLITTKGVKVLMEALELIEQQKSSAASCPLRVSIVGDGECRVDMELRCSQWESVAVHFHGPLDATELSDLYSSARLVVFPSTVPEGMGLVAVEAARYGKPVIAADHPPQREVVAGGGLFFRNEDAPDLAEKIVTVLKGPTLYEELRKSARERADAFAPRRYQEAWRAVIENWQSRSKLNSRRHMKNRQSSIKS